MSAEQEEQVLTIDHAEAPVLGGALNLAVEILEERTVETPFPLQRGQLPVLRRVNRRLSRRREGMAGERETGTGAADILEIRLHLEAAEAQAVRDAAGVLEELLESDEGRQLLSRIDWLRSPAQPVHEGELQILMDVQQQIDPTGVRPDAPRSVEDVTGVTSGELGPEEPLVDFDLPPANNAVRVAERLNQGPSAWESLPDAQTRVNEILGRHPGRDPICPQVLTVFAELTGLAVMAKRREGDHGLDAWGRFLPTLEDAYTALLAAVETGHCVSRNAQATLDQRIDDVMAAMRDQVPARGPAPDIEEEAQQFLNDLRSMADSTTDFTVAEADDERLLNHIEQLRAKLEDSIQNAHDRTRPPDMDDIREAILGFRPPSNASCSDYLVSMAELTVLAAGVEATRDQHTRQRDYFDLRNRIQHERRLLLDRMGADFVVVDEPLPTPQRECFEREALADLRESVQSILDPIEDDPDDVETRAYAALSDIRNAFEDARRGP